MITMMKMKSDIKHLRPVPFTDNGLSSITLESLQNTDLTSFKKGFYHPCEDAVMAPPDDEWCGDPVQDLWAQTARHFEEYQYTVYCEFGQCIIDADADCCACEYDAFNDVSHDQVEEVEDDLPFGRLGWEKEFGRRPAPQQRSKERDVVDDDPVTTNAHIIGEFQDCELCLIAGEFARITSIGLIPSREVKSRDTLVTNTLSWSDMRIFPCHAGYNFTRKEFLWFGKRLQSVADDMPRVSHLPAAVSVTVTELASRAREHLESEGYVDELLEFSVVPNVSGCIMKKPQNEASMLQTGAAIEHRIPLYSIGKYSAFAVASPMANAKRRVRDFYVQSRDSIGGNQAVATVRKKSICGCGKCWERMLFKDTGLLRLAIRTGLPIPFVRVNPSYYEDLLEEIADAHAQERFTVFVLEGDVY